MVEVLDGLAPSDRVITRGSLFIDRGGGRDRQLIISGYALLPYKMRKHQASRAVSVCTRTETILVIARATEALP
jgi:hypothetical protein